MLRVINGKLALFLCFLQVHTIFACTFLNVGDFNATIIYEINPENEDSCLIACFEDPICKFVKYSENLCTLYKEGSELQAKDGKVFELKRQLITESCSREVLLEPVIEDNGEPESEEQPEQALQRMAGLLTNLNPNPFSFRSHLKWRADANKLCFSH